jgi:hypothetical protein
MNSPAPNRLCPPDATRSELLELWKGEIQALRQGAEVDLHSPVGLDLLLSTVSGPSRDYVEEVRERWSPGGRQGLWPGELKVQGRYGLDSLLPSEAVELSKLLARLPGPAHVEPLDKARQLLVQADKGDPQALAHLGFLCLAQALRRDPVLARTLERPSNRAAEALLELCVDRVRDELRPLVRAEDRVAVWALKAARLAGISSAPSGYEDLLAMVQDRADPDNRLLEEGRTWQSQIQMLKQEATSMGQAAMALHGVEIAEQRQRHELRTKELRRLAALPKAGRRAWQELEAGLCVRIPLIDELATRAKSLGRSGRSRQGAAFELCLRSQPDVRDALAGWVSLDCSKTNGRAMFSHPEAHCVKAFIRDRGWVGNLYLLEGFVRGTGAVLHFDACQLPFPANFAELIPALVDAVAKEAARLGFKALTCNAEPGRMSNHRSWQAPFLDMITGATTRVRVAFPEGMHLFQSAGRPHLIFRTLG